MKWIDRLDFYKALRLHSTLNYVSPMTFETTGPPLNKARRPEFRGYGIRRTDARSVAQLGADHPNLGRLGDKGPDVPILEGHLD